MKFTRHSTRFSALVLTATGLVSIGLARADSYSATVLADNPGAYYRLEEAAGQQTIADLSASGANPGSLITDSSGVYPKLGELGIQVNSVRFHPYADSEGGLQTSYIEIPYNVDLNPTGPFSVEAWVRPTSVPQGGDYRCPVGNFGGWGDASGWFFYQTPGASSSWVWVQKGGGIWLGQIPVTKGKWDYLAAVYDGTNVVFYVNGENVGSANGTTAAPNSGKPLCIGQRADSYGYFDGNVDEVAWYPAALTPDQIQTHFRVGSTNFDSRPVPAAVLEDPASVTAYAGHSVLFTTSVDGTPPLGFQWYKGNTPIEGATSDTLTFICGFADNNTTYKVVVTNAYGSATSAQATLTVSTNLSLTLAPASITRTEGSKAAFRVQPDGAYPITYQWYRGSSPIDGQTNATLWLDEVTQADNNAAFSVKVSNPWSFTNSEPATLTVNARANPVPITGYAKVVMADDPVGYWRLDEASGASAAIDAAGSFDGTFDDAAGGGVLKFGLPTGIPHETDPALGVAAKARVIVPYALEMNPFGPFTAEGWFQPASVSADEGDYRTAFASMGSGTGGPIGWLLYQTPTHRWVWVLFADNWVSTWVGDFDDLITANAWYHIALTYDGSLFNVYVNGRLTASQTYDIFRPNVDGSANFGWRPDNDWKPFDGTIDDVAFYNKALTLEQVQAHYLATIRLTLTTSGSDMVLSWPFGTLQEATSVDGSYTDLGATSPYTVSPTANAKYYRVKLN